MWSNISLWGSSYQTLYLTACCDLTWKTSKRVPTSGRPARPFYFISPDDSIRTQRRESQLSLSLLFPFSILSELFYDNQVPWPIMIIRRGSLFYRNRSTYLSEYLPWAIRTGTTARLLMNVFFERRWEQQILELRTELNIPDPPGMLRP